MARDPDEQFVLDAVHSWAQGKTVPGPPAGTGWHHVAAAAGVTATIADGLVAAGRELHPDLRTIRLTAAVNSMRAMVEVDALNETLADVRWVVLKGPVLADAVYRTRASRTYDDLDVLVHPRDLGTALDRLEAGGFRLVDRNWPLIARMQRGEISLAGRTGTNIDLHWHPINDPHTRGQFAVDVDDMLRRARPVECNDRLVPSLAPADLVVYIGLHAALSGGHRLRWLLDLQQAVRWSGCTPDEIGWRARVHGLGLVTRTMLDRAASWVDDGLEPYAAAATRSSSWAALCRRVSRAEAPLPIEDGRRSGRSFFAATRRSSLQSARQLTVDLAHDSRERRELSVSPTIGELMTAGGSADDRAVWTTYAAQAH